MVGHVSRYRALLVVCLIVAAVTASALAYDGPCYRLGPVTCGETVSCGDPPCDTGWKEAGSVNRCSTLYLEPYGYTACEDDTEPTACGETGDCIELTNEITGDPYCFPQFFAGGGKQEGTGQHYKFDAQVCP